METAERVELVAYFSPYPVYLFVLRGQLDIAGVDPRGSRSGSLVFVFVDLGEGLCRARVLKLKVPRGQEGGGLVRPYTDDRVEVVLHESADPHTIGSRDLRR